MRQCGKLIKSLKQQVENDQNLRQEDEMKHLKMVIQLLSVYLKDVCKIVAQLREIHLKKTQNLQRICRLANLVDLYQTNLTKVKEEDERLAKRAENLAAELERTNLESFEEKWETLNDFDENKPLLKKSKNFRSASPELFDGPRRRGKKIQEKMTELDREIQSFSPEMLKLTEKEQEQLLAENQELFFKFSKTNNEIQKIENQMHEINRLQNTFAEKILQQEIEIEQINVKTIHTLDNLEAANDFIRKAIQNSASRRVIMLFCLIVLTFTLLFLDWYNP